MAEQLLGHQSTGFAAGFLEVANGDQIAYLLTAPTSGLIITHIAAWTRRGGSNNTNTQYAIWARNPDGTPGALLGYTAQISVGGAALRESPIAWSRWFEPSTGGYAGVRLMAGQQVYVGVQNNGANLDVGRPVSPAQITRYRRNVGNVNPTDPFGIPGAVGLANTPGIWVRGTVNTAPTVVTGGPSGSISTSAPNFTFTFTDDETGTPTFDHIRWYQIELVDDIGSLIWNPDQIVTDASLRASGLATIPYTGPALGTGNYQWRVRVQDDVLAYSDWTPFEAFSVDQLGSVDVTNAGPTGKQETGVTSNFTARWESPGGLDADRARFELYGVGATTPFKVSPEIILSPTVDPLAFFTLTAAQVGFGTLESGSYEWRVQLRDTNGGWSNWSARVPFNVNFLPNQPSGLLPVPGPYTSRPTLQWKGEDPDLDDLPGTLGVTAEIELTKPSGAIISITGVVTYDFDTGLWSHPLTSGQADEASGTYSWRVRLKDVSVPANAGFGPFSASSMFTLQVAPVVSIGTPAANAEVSTSTPTFTFSVADALMAFYQVEFYRFGSPTAFFSSGMIPVSPASGAAQYLTPPQANLKNHTVYDAKVTIQTSTGVVSSKRQTFTVAYTAADNLGSLGATLLAYAHDTEATSVLLEWVRLTSIPQAEFEGYIVWRRESGQGPDEAVAIAKIAQGGQTSFIDHAPPPNRTLVYGVTQLRKAVGTRDVRSSDMVETETFVPLTTMVLVSTEPGAGGTHRAPIREIGPDFALGFNREEGKIKTWGTKGVPTNIGPPVGYGYKDAVLSFVLKSDGTVTADERVDDWTRIVESGHSYCLLMERSRVFVTVVARSGWLKRHADPGKWVVSLSLEQTAHNEAVRVPS